MTPATRLQLSLEVQTICHASIFICLLSAKLGRIFIVKQLVMSWYGCKLKFFHLLTNARHNVYRSIGTILCSEKTSCGLVVFSEHKVNLDFFSGTLYNNFLRNWLNGSPALSWPGTNVKIKVLAFINEQPSAGDLVEASSNLFAIVKTTARKIFTASSLRKKSRDFFRLRSNSEVYSSSISDCTAHNEAYCDKEQ